jgi:hypothetical protein
LKRRLTFISKLFASSFLADLAFSFSCSRLSFSSAKFENKIFVDGYAASPEEKKKNLPRAWLACISDS